MHDPEQESDLVANREQSALGALEAYRERRRHRRGEDTYFGSSDLFRDAVEAGISVDELDSRRSSIMAEAQADGVPLDLAEILYDVAREEGLDPSIAYELVRTGLGVAPPPDGITNASEVPTSDKYLPPWMFPASAPDQLLRERMLRVSLRRLRAILAEEAEVEAAFRRFAREPDVGHYGY